MSNIGVSEVLIFKISGEQSEFSEKLELRSYLVVEQSLVKDTSRIFVSTSFGTYSGNQTHKEAAFGYFGSKAAFTGYLIISEPQGQYITSYFYDNGKRELMAMGMLSTGEIPQECIGIIFEETSDMLTRADDEECENCSFMLRPNGTCPVCNPDFEPVTVYGYIHPSNPLTEDDSWNYEPGGGETGTGGGETETGDGGGGGGGGGTGGNSNNNNNNTVYPTLELEAVGNGSVSPGGMTYYSPNQNVTITATPHSSAVFGGWYEHSSIISNSHSLYIQMNYDRCITGVFHSKNSPCGELASKYRNNDAMNLFLDVYLRHEIAINGNREHGATISTTGNRQWATSGTAAQVDLTISLGVQYKEAHHSHIDAISLTPSPEDLYDILKIATWGYTGTPPNGFIFTISNSTETIAFEVENMAKFKQFAINKGFNELKIEKFNAFRIEYYDEIIKYNAADYETNGTNRAIEWLLKNDSGLKVSRATLIQGEDSKVSDWKAVKLENNQVIIIDCNEL